MKTLGKLISVKPLVLELYGSHEAELEELREQTLDIELTPHRKRRSMNANALCWQLCGMIGQAMKPPIPREEVYRSAIKDAGQCTMVTVRRDALDAFMRGWRNNGIGWFAEAVDQAQVERGSPYVDLIVYYGSSSYDVKEMGVLLDRLMDEAEQMELPIVEERKMREKAMREWAKRQRDNPPVSPPVRGMTDALSVGEIPPYPPLKKGHEARMSLKRGHEVKALKRGQE